jgi:hypothetical protein
MNHESTDTNRPTRREALRQSCAPLAALLVVVVVVSLSACGGGSPSSVAHMATTRPLATAAEPRTTTTIAPSNAPQATAAERRTTTTIAPLSSHASSPSEQSRQAELLQFSQCMRSHGVPNFPDLSATAGILNGLAHSGVNPGAPAFQSALHACKKYNAAGGVTPAQSAAETAKLLRFSQCMRSHGVPDYPDPTIGPVGEQVMDLRGIDLSNPTFQAASKACQEFVPGGGSK